MARDRLGKEEFAIRGRIVLNAAGPWAPDFLRQTLNLEIRPAPRFSRDAGFIIKGRRTGDEALACRLDTKDPDAVLSRKGRHVFLAPWRDYTYAGTWHVVHTKSAEDVTVRQSEVETFIDEINASHPAVRLQIDDVTMIHSGLTLFGENKPGQTDLRFAHRSLLIDHKKEHGLDGLVTLVGVRATMARGMAERAIDLLLHKRGNDARASATDHTPIHGGSIDRFEDLVRDAVSKHAGTFSAKVMRSLVHNYGSEYGKLLQLTESDPALAETLGESQTLKAQVIHALRYEMAQTLGDVVFRRTDLGTGGHPGQDAIDQCVLLMTNELGWGQDRQRLEIDKVLEQFPRFGKSVE
jgi:glycerol-3-phosphate dehydrogenase